MYKVFTFGLGLVFSFTAQAQECNPEYRVQYNSCAHESHPKQVQPMETEWLLMVKGGRRVTDGACTDADKMQAVQNMFPTATNIRFSRIRDVDASFRGLGKRDIECKYTMDIPRPMMIASPACGIASVAASCFVNVGAAFVEQCINAPIQTLEQKWQKAACLTDIRANIAYIQGRSGEMLARVNAEFEMLKQTLGLSNDEEQIRLLRWARQR